MKALILEEYMHLACKEVPVPEINSDEVLVQVRSVGICGSDVHGIDGSTGRRIPPIIMGHEAAGIIAKTGNSVREWKTGDRVTFDSTIYSMDDWYTKNGMYNLSDGRKVLGVSAKEFKRQGAFAEYVAVPEHILYRIPDNVTFTQAALVEPAAVALHAINLTPLKKGDAVVVIGAGMVGMFVIQLLKIKGYSPVIAIDLQEERLDLAKKLGANFIFTPDDQSLIKSVLSLTSGRGADAVIEVVGINDAIQTGISLLRKGGTITLIGNLSSKVDLPLQAIVTRQLRVQGSCAICGEYPEILELIANGKLDMEAILTAEVPLEEGPMWFTKLYNKEKGLMKIILKPFDE
jgi:L-iditol 2-dehydrogenase